MTKAISVVAVLGIALLAMGQSCSYVGDLPPSESWMEQPTWTGWLEEGRYIYWTGYGTITLSVQATGKTIDYYLLIIPLEDLERFRNGQPYRSQCAHRAQDTRIHLCNVSWAGYWAAIFWIPWLPDFISGDLYAKVWVSWGR